MKKLNRKQKLIIIIAIITIIVIIGIVVGANAIRVGIANSKYESSNSDSSNSNLLPEYIKKGITLGGVTGTLEDLDTSDATATEWDIAYGKTAYVKGEKITGLFVPRSNLKVGDYVEYTPDTASDYSIASNVSGYTSNQIISQDTSLKWRIMSVNDDGTVDLVSDKSTNESISLSGAVGYNNAVYLLDEASSKLYSNSELEVVARNIKVEDYEKKLNSKGNEAIKNFTDSGTALKVGQTRYTGKFFSYSFDPPREIYPYYPALYEQEKGAGINSTTVSQDGAERSDRYYTSPTTQGAQVSTSGLTATQTGYRVNATDLKSYFDDEEFYNLIFNEDTFIFSSRYTNCSPINEIYSYEQINWGLYIYSNGGGIWLGWLYNTDPHSATQSRSIRPVITLNTNIQIYGGDGSAEYPYQLTK